MELTKELAEEIFMAGGDYRIMCANLTDEKIDKITWSEESIDFEEFWETLQNHKE